MAEYGEDSLPSSPLGYCESIDHGDSSDVAFTYPQLPLTPVTPYPAELVSLDLEELEPLVDDNTAFLQDQAARKIQQFFRPRLEIHQQKDAAALKIQRRYRQQVDKQQLKLEPMCHIDRLSAAALQELRHLARKPLLGADARQSDEDERFFDILMHVPAFREAVEPLPPRARLCAVRKLQTRQLPPSDLLLCSAKGEPLDAVALVLTGEALIYLVHPEGQRDLTQRLGPGTAVSASMIDKGRINKECRPRYCLQVGCNQTIEVLRLSRELLQDAVKEEENREACRSLACSALRGSLPWGRETQDVAAITNHLMANVACFEGVSFSDLERVCQQAELIQLESGEYLSRCGDEADGLRVLLSGSASEFLPPLPALEGFPKVEDPCTGEIDALPKTFGERSKTICVDDVCGEWELCLQRDDCVLADVVADCECEALFINRALYSRYLRQARYTKVLQQASLAALMHSSAAALRAERYTSVDVSQLSWQATVGDSSLELDTSLCELTATPAPVWMLPEFASALDCMLSHYSESTLPLMKSFPRDLRKEFCARGKLWRALKGEVIFREGDPGDKMFVVVRGEVGLFQGCEDTDFRAMDQQMELSWQLREQGAIAVEQLLAKSDAVLGDCSKSDDNIGGRNVSQETFNPRHPRTNLSTMSDLAWNLYDVAARRSQALSPARVCTLPAANVPRCFVRDGEAEMFLLGCEIKEEDADFRDSEQCFIDVRKIGLCAAIVQEGQAMGVAGPGSGDAGPPRLHTAVALSGTDLFVLDRDAVSEVLSAERDGVSSGSWASDILLSRESHQRTPQDLLILDALIRKHQAFTNMESRTRAEICRKMRIVTVPQGETVCRQGDKAIGFFHILQGQASLHMLQEQDPHLCLLQGEACQFVQDDDGPMILCLGKGSSFGEQVLLGKEEVQQFTIRAVEDLDLAWIESYDYDNAIQDYLGEASIRRRALEVLRKPIEHRTDSDAEALIHILRHIEWINELEPPARLEVARQASLLHVPQGAYVLQDEQVCALSAVLAGCIGRYPVEAYAESQEYELQEEEQRVSVAEEELGTPDPVYASSRPGSQLSHHPSIAASGSVFRKIPRAPKALKRSPEVEDYLRMCRELQELRMLNEQLTARIGRQPLQATLQERLQSHSVHQKLEELEVQVGNVPEQTVLEASKEPVPSMPLKSKFDSSNLNSPSVGHSSSATTLAGASEIGTKNALSVVMPSSLIESSWLECGMSAEKDAFDLTQVELEGDFCEDGPSLPPGMLNVEGCDADFREGDVFGAWTQSEPVVSSDEFCAHMDTEILVVNRSSYDNALRLVSHRAERRRAEFLRLHLPPEASTELVERLAPLFHEESKQKGYVLVREGGESNTIWVIVQGACHCTMAPASEENDAAKPQAAEKTKHKHKHKHKHKDDDVSSAVERNTAAVDAPLSDAGAAVGAQALPAGTSIGRCTSARGMAVGGNGQTHMTLGLLSEGKFVGLYSALLHQPEPLTVMVSSANVKLLAVPKRAFLPQIHSTPVFNVLKRVLRSQSEWHSHQSARLAALPDQVSTRLDKVRCEVQQAHVPRMIDSPFLRRHGQYGLEMLDIIVERYGRLVHPESEWLFAARTPNFYSNVRLANLQEGHAEASFYEYPQKPSGERPFANFRFRTFNKLSVSIQQESSDNDYLASDTLDGTIGLSPQCVSKLNPANSSFADEDDESTPGNRQGPFTSEFERKLQEVEKARVDLHQPSRIQTLTEQSDMRMQMKTARRTAARQKPPTCPGRELPKAMQVFKSKAMRDRQLGITPILASAPIQGKGSLSKGRQTLQCQSKESLPPLTNISCVKNARDPFAHTSGAFTSEAMSDFSLDSPHSVCSELSVIPKSLRRGSLNLEKAANQLARTAADKSLRIAVRDESLRMGATARGTVCHTRPGTWNPQLWTAAPVYESFE